MIDMTADEVMERPFEALERWLALPGARHIVIESKDRSSLLGKMPNPNLMVRLVDETGTVAQGMVDRDTWADVHPSAKRGTALEEVIAAALRVATGVNDAADDGPCFDGGCDR